MPSSSEIQELKERVADRLAPATFDAATGTIEVFSSAGIPKGEAAERVACMLHGMTHMAEFCIAVLDDMPDVFPPELVLSVASEIALGEFAKILDMIETSYPEED